MATVAIILVVYWLFKSQIKAVVKQAGSVSSDALDSVLTIAGNAAREARKDSLDDLRKLGESMGIKGAKNMTQSQLAALIDAQLKA